jgi:hypothetical protein
MRFRLIKTHVLALFDLGPLSRFGGGGKPKRKPKQGYTFGKIGYPNPSQNLTYQSRQTDTHYTYTCYYKYIFPPREYYRTLPRSPT